MVSTAAEEGEKDPSKKGNFIEKRISCRKKGNGFTHFGRGMKTDGERLGPCVAV